MQRLIPVGKLHAILGNESGARLSSAAIAQDSIPAGDWRIGSHFLLCAAMQAVAVLVAWQYFRTHRVHDSHGERQGKEEMRA